MKEEKCYKCDTKATSREHIPPICIFPEAKDLREDLRKNLLTVPSCDKHNLRKTKDDEFLMICLSSIVGNNIVGFIQTKTKVRRALDRKHQGFIERIIKDAKDVNVKTEDGMVFPLLSGKADLKRLRKCIDYIAHGIYYLEYGRNLKGETITLFNFIQYPDKNTNQMMTFLKDRFDNESDVYLRKGSNPKVFYYQIVPPDNFGLIAVKLTFFEGTHIFTTIKDENAKKPFDLGTQLILNGVKTTIEYNGKNYEFN
jgi:hypothetical protein